MTRLRLQLVALLVAVALLPAIFAFPTVSSLLGRSLGAGLNARFVAGLDAGLASTRALLEIEKDRFVRDWTGSVAGGFEVLASAPPELAGTGAARHPIDARSANNDDSTSQPRALLSQPERVGTDLAALAVTHHSAASETTWIRRALPAELAARADTLAAAMVLAQGVQHQRTHLLRAFLATFLVINAAFLGLVIALGLFLANRLTRPLEGLARGMDAVAGGDLDVRLPTSRRGAIEQLAVNFNEMASRLRSQQADLLRLEKESAWRDMARRLAHEVKNPLTPIQLAADEIRNAYPGEDTRYRALLDEGTNIIREEVDRLRRLVQEFSRFARLPEPRWEWIDVAHLLSAIGGLYGPERVEMHLPPQGSMVRCDQEQMHRLLVNLVNNALEAQEKIGLRGPIRVGTIEGLPELRIDVADRGPGVPSAERERIFEPGITGRADGMGLGLAIARSIATLHSGRIVVSDREGGGAVFSIHLPREHPDRT